MQRDRSWMSLNRGSADYMAGVKRFMKVARKDMKRRKVNVVLCPCQGCSNVVCFTKVRIVQSLLIHSGFMKGYTCWTKHGETPVVEDVRDVSNNNDMPNPEVHIHQDCEMPDQDNGDSEIPDFHDDDDDFPMQDLHQMIKDFEAKR